MVTVSGNGSGSRMEGVSGTHILSPRVRKTIQSIKEIVGNHSDSHIYVVLKETNMDPNETTQKLLNQDPFHEVKRRRDRKKESQNQNVGNNNSAEHLEAQRYYENVGRGMKFHVPSVRNVRRANYSRNTLSGNGREFRVVRDNRVISRIYKEVKPPSLQCSTSANEQSNANTSEKGSSTAATNQRSSGARNSSQALNGPSDSHATYSKDAVPNVNDRKFASKGKQGIVLNAAVKVQSIKPNNAQQNSTTVASTSSAVGVYSSSTDPVHVPSPDSRVSGVVGAIRREVGAVGVRRQSSDNKVKQQSVPSNSNTNSLIEKTGTSANSFQPVGALSKTERFSQTNVNESSSPGMSVSRPSLRNQYNSRPHQLAGHRVSQHNKEWKPKASQKSSSNSPGVIGTPKKTSSPTAKNSKDIESITAELQDKLSQDNVHENQNVIIAQHIRVPETDRCRLTFGTIGTELGSLRHQSDHQFIRASEKSNEKSTASLTVPAPELSTDDVSGSKQLDLQDDHVRSTGSVTPASDAAAEQQLPDNKVSSSPHNYANTGLVRDNVPSYAPESHQQGSHDMPGFSAYDPPTVYEVPYFRPTVNESVRGQGQPSPNEGLSSHAANSIPASTIPMMQQQQPPVAQMYPQLHVSHYANLMPYRQFLSPVYVPPMGMPGYSSNHPYPHPTNGSSYVLMPGGGSHLNANSLKYGIQQFKPVPAGFGNYANPTGYAMISPGVVGGATTLEDSSRVKYKDNLYVPNPQAETSEIWLQNPREIPGMQSTPYYNMQAAHGAYMPSHASFNVAAAQSSHMQFPGMYPAPPQPAAIPGPHHLGPTMGNNVGVGVAAAAPGAQISAYQQPQMGHLNWPTNF